MNRSVCYEALMRVRQIPIFRYFSCRRYSTSTPITQHLAKPLILPDSSVQTFRQNAFDPRTPAVLPAKHFASIPACKKWFKQRHSTHPVALNHRYLEQHGGETFVPLEYTTPGEHGNDAFQRLDAPLKVFLAATRLARKRALERMYLAQCQVTDLPQTLRADLPTPELVTRAGQGDIYDTNIWIGLAPTNTPLHKDPNPNLFVQLAGAKMVRIFTPELGLALYTQVQEELGKDGRASIRDEGMMHGKEKALLDHYVWAENDILGGRYAEASEAHLEAGDAIFIPKGWWHSIKGIGNGVTASVSSDVSSDSDSNKANTMSQANWWFR